MKISWANIENFEESDVVIVGIPDESKSHALRKGTSEAPHRIREISQIRDIFKRGDEKSLALPLDGITKKIYDYGNIDRINIDQVFERIVSKSKIPVSIGGDHSITTEILKSMSRKYGLISLIYFDAHPDFIGSTQGYYGSVIYDVLPYIDIKKSILIGVRTPEQEEITNIKQYGLLTLTPSDILRNGIQKTEESIFNKIGKNPYISLDMDVIDPAYAPGVSVPVPFGVGSLETVTLLKDLAKSGIMGFDIMEVCPNYDVKDRTSHLASRMIAEVISSLR